MSQYVVVMFNGFNSSKYDWSHRGYKKIDFLDKIKKITGVVAVHTFDQQFFNFAYYSKPTPGYKKLWRLKAGSKINFKIKDLDHVRICKKVRQSLKKYGNKKYIVIGHSYSGTLALLFSKMYKDECVLCCCIDNTPHLPNFPVFISKDEQDILKTKYKNDKAISRYLKIIKNTKSFDEIKDLLQFILILTYQDRAKYYDHKLYVPTIIFRAYKKGPKYALKNKFSKKERTMFMKDKNLISYNADHEIWHKQKHSDTIIRIIRSQLRFN